MRRILPLILLTLALPPASAQATYRIAGTVVSAIDQHPLQRASVQILNPDNQQSIQTTTSDEYGRFAFTNVRAGLFELQGSAPNYLSTLYDEHEGFNTGIVTGAGVDTESLVLKLQPEAVITGLVVNEAAEPVENASVRLFLQSHGFGEGRLRPAATATTDDLGRFELAHLKPGTYFVAVSASPWYAVHPAAQQPNAIGFVDQSGRRVFVVQPGEQRTQPNNGAGFADSVDPTLDVAYATEFYPGTDDSAHAQPIVIRGGESPDLHFQLSPRPAVSITIPRGRLKPGQPDIPPQLRMSIFGQLEDPPNTTTRMSSTQTVITGLAPGDYILTDPRNPNPALTGTPLHVAERNTEAAPAAESTSGLAHVHIVTHPADGATPSSVSIALVHPHSEDWIIPDADPKGEFTIDAPPGDYYFDLTSNGKRMFPRQILSGDQPIASSLVHLAADESRFFTIAYTEGTHTLKGVVRKDGHGFPGAFILLFPTSESPDPHIFFRQQSDLDGSFDIQGIAPGSYTLLAIDGGWDIDWRHNNTLARFFPLALKIGIPESAGKTHYLTQPVAAQPR